MSPASVSPWLPFPVLALNLLGTNPIDIFKKNWGADAFLSPFQHTNNAY
jgi:hypothetical protein